MRPYPSLAAGIYLMASAMQVPAQEGIAEILSDPALNLSQPAGRARAVERIAAIENARLAKARAKAKALGLAMRVEKPGGGVMEIIDFEGDQPVYLMTTNVNAAISTAANLVQPAPYLLNGTGVTVGIWDGGSVLASHQEFANGSRVTVKDGAAVNYHATHVGGTIAAAGVVADAKGMAGSARIDSYNWTNDTSEMTSRAATGPGQLATMIYLSNHSYGTGEGWSSNQWTGTGADQNAYDANFGQYGTAATAVDSLVYNAPYLTVFWSAGNQRSDNPSNGAQVVISGSTVSYNSSIHPPGDGVYRSGFDTIAHRATAKNIITVGAANDAVTSGLRDPAKSTLTSFSSTGPTDDGRIKPDLVANGASLSSTDSDNSSDYATLSGTSMSSPNACGSAALVVDQYNRLFNGAMRASTLKGLLIHTATDLGNPGPDYRNGWGLIHTKEAVDLIIDHHASPSKQRMIEAQVSTSVPTKTYSFLWDNSSALRATLSWTDPVGSSTSAHDSRTPTLKNNLNLKLIAPNGNEYFPFVMPFVGTWTTASMSQNATTGINHTDPVEQVLIANPGQTGTWQAVVSYTGALTNNLQNFSLLFSGVSDGVIPLVINNITPAEGTVGATVSVDITGTDLSVDTSIRLRKPGRADIIGTSVQKLNGTTLRCQFDLTGATSGEWNLVAINPDLETYILLDAFTISGSLSTIWSENFDGTVSGWTTTASLGSNSWNIVSTRSHSPTKSFFAAAPASKTTTYLVSPSISIPQDLTNLQIEFWHWYNLEGGFDGGRFSLSVDNGPWFDVTDVNSGAAFIANGYNTSMTKNGQVGDFAGLQAWSGTSNNVFIKTSINLTDTAKYADKTLRMRWGLATSPKNASTGWHLDSVSLLSDSSTPNQNPVVTVAASTSALETQDIYQVIRGKSTDLSVTVSDDAGEDSLTYTWEVTSGPAAVGFSLNGNNAAKSTTIDFTQIGDYLLTVTALDAGGLTATSSINVRVLASDSFVVTPDTSLLSVGGTQQFNAAVRDQFGTLKTSQPSPIDWSASGGGSINPSGLFTASVAGGPYTITATGGEFSASAEVTVNPAIASIQIGNLNQTYDGNVKPVIITTTPPDLAHLVTYNLSSSVPRQAGSYEVVATIIDPNYEGSNSDTLVIDKAAQTIEFAPLAAVGNDQAPFELTATATSGLPVSYSSSDPTVAMVSGNTVTITSDGTTAITASQAGNSNYLPAPNVQRDLVVQRTQPLALTWDANGTDQTSGGGAWLGNNLWWDGSAHLDWVEGSNAVFGGTATVGGIITLASPTTVNAIIINPHTGAYTLGTSGNGITLKSGITKNTGSAAVTFASGITLGSAQTWTNHSTATLTTANGADLLDSGGHEVTIDGVGNITLGVINNTAPSITGSGALIKNGTGVLAIGGENAGFTGNVMVNAGLLRVNNPAAITGNLRLNGGVYEHYWNDPYTRTLGTGAGQIQMTGGSSGFSGNGNTGMTVTLNNDAGFEVQWGDALFNPSTLVLQADTAQVASSITFANKIDLNGADRTIHVSGGTTGTARATLSGQIRNSAGTAGVTKTGAGVLSLTHTASSWNGETHVNEGKLFINGSLSNTDAALNVASGATLGGTGIIGRNVTIADGGKLEFDLHTIAASHDGLDISSGRSFTFSGASELTITSSGDATAGIYTLITGGNDISGAAPAIVHLPDGWLAKVSISGNSLLLEITLPTPYGIWANGTFANAFTAKEPGDDQDNDGLANLLEYAFASDPTVTSTQPIAYAGGVVTNRGQPVLIEQDGTYYAVFGRRVDHAAAGLNYAVRFSADLEPGYWETSSVEPAMLATDGVIEAVAVPYPGLVPTASGPKIARFFHVGVSSN